MSEITNAVPDFGVKPEGQAPLARLLSDLRRQSDFSRMQKLASFFQDFHLKWTTTSSVNGRTVVIDGKSVVNFGSANYLGLEQHPEVKAASIRATESLGTHAGCSRIFSSHENIVLLERELSELVGAPSTLIGHNISQIHAGVLPALFSSSDSVLFIDRHAHTSMYQASLIASAKGARLVRVDVSDLEGLQRTISAARYKRGALLIDGVYSMQGHVPAIPELDRICRDNGLLFYVDDAHGVGILGARGGGVAELFDLKYDNVVIIGSLQKGFGTYGGFISGQESLIAYLRVMSKAYVFSGTLQPAAVEGAREAVRIARSEEGVRLRARLSAMSEYVRRELRSLGYDAPLGDSPIVPVTIGPDVATLICGRHLFDNGIYLNSVLFPAVPMRRGVLRISLTTLHTDAEIALLIEGFRKMKPELVALKRPVLGSARTLWRIARSKWKRSAKV